MNWHFIATILVSIVNGSFFVCGHLEFGSLLGHICETPAGRVGECQYREVCDVVVPTHPGEYFYPPALCGNHGNLPLYCCIKLKTSEPSTQPTALIFPNFAPANNDASVEAPFVNFECGSLEPNNRRKIFFPDELEELISQSTIDASHDGRTRDARPAYAKHTALLLAVQGGIIKPFCGGVLINEHWVITAAHCVENSTICSSLIPCLVRLGEYNLNTSSDGRHQDYELVDIRLHVEWLPNVAYHDIALLRLNQTVLFTDNISPICLPWGEESLQSLNGTDIVFTGWGGMFFTSISNSPVIQEGTVTVVDVRQCTAAYSTMPDYTIKWPQGMSITNTLCAIDTDGIMDPCTGESGGPAAYISKSNRLTLGGIITLGSGCGNNIPGVYVPVPQARYLNWIKAVAFNQ